MKKNDVGKGLREEERNQRQGEKNQEEIVDGKRKRKKEDRKGKG